MTTELTDKQKIDILWKKQYNIHSTTEEKEYYNEDLALSNRNFVLPNKQIWREEVPDTAPTDESYPHIVEYTKLSMTPIYNTFGTSYSLTELKDSIPFTHDPAGSYYGALYDSTDAEIKVGVGSWFIDHNTGVLTFYNYSEVSSFVDVDNPPKLTFHTYEGLKGLTTYSTTHTQTETFNEDILIDDRDVSTFANDEESKKIQFGATNEGAWKISIKAGATTNTDSKMIFERYESSVWVSKGEF